MSQLVPVSQRGAIWPAYSGVRGDRPQGSYWSVKCTRCGTEGPTQAHGRCRSCEAQLVPALPEVKTPARRRLPGRSIFEIDLLEVLPRAITLPIQVAGRMAMIGFFLLFFWPLGLILLIATLRDGFGVSPGADAPEGTHLHVPNKFQVERAWVDVSRLRGRRGLVIQFSLQTHGLVKKRLELAVRVRGPDGRYLPALLRNYRGTSGEVLVRHATKPLKSQSSRFPRLWVFLPLRAMPIPAAVQRMTVTLEAAFACEGRLLAESHVPYVFVPTADDRTTLALPEAAGGADEALDASAITLMENAASPEDTSCGVCGDGLAGEPVVRCALCESASHRECWEYMDGCSTYACEGRPA
jgi:hypothetical protein